MTAQPTSRVTIKDVAARAGVSKGAVSLAFNHKPGLSEATRDRIFEAARELGWAPNLTARTLAGSRVDVVGPRSAAGAAAGARTLLHGVRVGCGERADRAELPAAAAARAERGGGGRAAGVVVAGTAGGGRSCRLPGGRSARRGDRAAGPAGGGGGAPPLTGGLTSVWTDDATAVTEAVRYLAALGHRRIARVGCGGARAHGDEDGRVRRGGGPWSWRGPGR